jgi:hypothetical protein
MRALPPLLLALISCARTQPASTPPPAPLVLERAIALSGPGDFQPSALALRQGHLYTVSDKSSDTLLEINLGEIWTSEINLGEAGRRGKGGKINLGGEGEAGVGIGFAEGGLDLEGIAVEGGGDFLVVSEAFGRVLRVPAGGTGARWVEIDFAGAARAVGLLATAGAGFEGVAVLGDRLIVAAEREPRGLVVARAGRVWAWQMEASVVPLPRGRRPDFSDLTVDRGRLYALVRNADAIVELLPAGDRFVEGRWWSFAEAVAAYPYQDRRFGMAEGLAMDAEHVYVVLDNNGTPRVGASLDRRAMLFVFARPAP